MLPEAVGLSAEIVLIQFIAYMLIVNHFTAQRDVYTGELIFVFVFFVNLYVLKFQWVTLQWWDLIILLTMPIAVIIINLIVLKSPVFHEIKTIYQSKKGKISNF